MQSQDEINAAYGCLAARESLLPIKVSPFYAKKVAAEIAALGHTQGPLHRIVYPSIEKINAEDLGEPADFVNDRTNMPSGLEGVAVRTYENRLLVYVTTTCFSHCSYCFRQDVLSELHATAQSSAITSEQIELVAKYLKQNGEIDEVILSGGDPLSIPIKILESTLNSFSRIKTVKNIRIHTRAAVYQPQIFDDTRIRLLADYNVRLVSHICHPYEICETVAETFKRLKQANIRLYNQFPLIRGVNDHVDVLKCLLTNLDNLGIRNLSIFIPDPIKFSAPYRIPFDRICSFIDELNHTTSSWINATRVVLVTECGKVRREDILDWDKKRGLIRFQRKGKIADYQDFPADLDQPGDIKNLLWQAP